MIELMKLPLGVGARRTPAKPNVQVHSLNTEWASSDKFHVTSCLDEVFSYNGSDVDINGLAAFNLLLLN